RWMSSGPRTGIGEIDVPTVQPGSSIMPGKINPVLCESVCQVAAQVTGNDAAITVGGQAGNFELNVMKPVMAHNLLQSIELLANVSGVFERCVSGVEANVETCETNAEESLSIVTALAPHIGYDEAAEIAKQALKEDKTIREVALERGAMEEDELDEVLDPEAMTERGIL
ncbi:MAG: lyase family protein, partial [Halobacteria archaeon]|nr:lyase family protein [Halobacteria archaeon]